VVRHTRGRGEVGGERGEGRWGGIVRESEGEGGGSGYVGAERRDGE